MQPGVQLITQLAQITLKKNDHEEAPGLDFGSPVSYCLLLVESQTLERAKKKCRGKKKEEAEERNEETEEDGESKRIGK